ncbi:glycosyltransferase family 4 protein [Roseibium sp.]|uniref:glycosyltransferase family 4 protein n=1 Tax=Roseibium sp. TaxID=1936156 RepID=UPI003A973A11
MTKTENKHRILFICTQMEAGGVQVRATSMLKSLREEGYDARLIFLYTKRPIFNDLEGAISLSASPPKSVSDYAGIFSRLAAEFKSFKPTAVVGFAHYSSPIASVLGWLNGTKIRLGTQVNPPTSHGVPSRLMDLIVGTLGLYTRNIATSDAIKDCFRRYPSSYRKRIKVIFNGVDLKQSKITKQEARSTFGLDPSKFYILNCGRISQQKNQKFLIELLSRVPDVHLAILGDGELRPSLEEEVAKRGLRERVTFVGEVQPSKVKDFLRCGDVFLFPSLYEAFGLALVEAMAAGLPVIASNHPALVEIADSGGLTLSLDIDTWCEKLNDLIELRKHSPDSFYNLGKIAAERSSLFSYERMYSNFKNEITSDY